jgi:hypothetical protein
MPRCNICNCEYNENNLHRTGLLNLRGSEDDYICDGCKFELFRFARSLQTVANKVRFEEIGKKPSQR